MSRRLFLGGVSAAGLARLTGAKLDRPIDPAQEVAAFPSVVDQARPLSPVPIEGVVVDDPFWTPKRDVWRTVTLRDCFRKFEEQGGGALNNFDRVRDGLAGGHAGNPWQDGLVYEMIHAASDFLRSQPDPDLEAWLDGAIARIVAAAAKDPGGYVNTFTQLEEPDHRWGLNGGLEVWQHEFYNLGALVDAGVHHYRATGKTALLEAGVRVANTIVELVGPPPMNLVPSHELPEEAMLGLYLLLREQPQLAARLPEARPERYLGLAEFWIENRGRNSGKPDWETDRRRAEEFARRHDGAEGRVSWGAYAQDRTPVLEETEIVGHAVRATLLWSAVAAACRTNGRDDYRESAMRVWESMALRRMHITGGVGAYAEEEKFGPDYALSNNAYLETCAAVGAGFFHANMNLLFGHAAFADELERVLYNGVLGGVSIQGDTYTYQNPLVGDERRERWSWHDCPCCPPMFLKMMGAMPGVIYATDEDSAYLNLYVGGTGTTSLKGTGLVLRQSTEYPWDGEVRVAVEPESPLLFGLMLRVPGWCRGASVRVNGRQVASPERVRGYIRIERTWTMGDVVELSLPMPVQVVRSHPKVVENLGRAALMRGPLVFCVESVDNPDGFDDLALAHRPEFSVEKWPDRLGGVVAIRAYAVDGGEWPDGLYAAGPVRSSSHRCLVAVPFYANANRGPAKMAVWLPRED